MVASAKWLHVSLKSSPHDSLVQGERCRAHLRTSRRSGCQEAPGSFPVCHWFGTISIPASLGAIPEILSPPGKNVVGAQIMMLFAAHHARKIIASTSSHS